jgi:long-chain acyl-CoA synthetase
MEKIWLKSYAHTTPAELDFEDITVYNALSRSAKEYPDNPALYFQGAKISYTRLDDLVSRFAQSMKDLGVKPGDKVALLLPNIVQMVVAYYGVMRCGGIVVSNNPLYTNPELEHQFNDSGATYLVCLDLLVPRMLELRKSSGIKKIISCHIRDYLPFPLKQLFPVLKRQMHLKTPAAPEVYEFIDLVDKSSPIPNDHVHKPSSMDDTAVIMYTGGTTGVSKGVELTHGNISYNCQQGKAWFPDLKQGREIVIGALPFFHSFGMTVAMNAAICFGLGLVLIPKPEPKAILDAIHKYKATYIPAVPTMYTGMNNHPEIGKYDLGALRYCFSGGAPLPMETFKQFGKTTGAQICEGYGLTETSPAVLVNPFGGKSKPGTIGLPISNTDAKLVDVDDYNKEITEFGEPGELCVKGPQIMKGYLNRPEATAETIRDGWLLTGDIAVVDEEGYFTIVDRKKDMIISGGFNIYPRDIDEVLFTHPKILEACAIGVPDDYSGERIKAYIVLKEGETATEDEIIDFCRERLTRYKIPKYIEFTNDLPKSAIGKILRKELRKIDQERNSKE